MGLHAPYTECMKDRMIRSRGARAAVLILCIACMTGLGVAGHANPSAATVSWEFASGVVGGLGGAALAVIWISETVDMLGSRLARTANVVGSVTVLGGTGAAVGVLAAARLLHASGNIRACFLGAFAGAFASMWLEPLLYAIRIPEGIAEFVGMLMLPIAPAIGATIGFNQPNNEALASEGQ